LTKRSTEARRASPEPAGGQHSCRFCGAPVRRTFVDLGMSPLCQTHIEHSQLNDMEPFYPLHAFVCERCFLVQLGEYVSPQEIFGEYAYFSSFSDSWIEHARTYAASVTERFDIGRDSKVIEVASNDGYLLQHFLSNEIPVLGIEPAANVAEVAIGKGIPTVVRFLGAQTAGEIVAESGAADLVIGNNVLAHVPDLNDFVAGLRTLLKPSGVLTMEFPHLQRLMASNQFDTIYHEHFSYFSFYTVERVFAAHDMVLFDVEELPTHGGSLRIFACHKHALDQRPVGKRVDELLSREKTSGIDQIETYVAFEENVKRTKRRILEFLIQAKAEGKSIAGYGAPGKGNTLLNYCGIRGDFLDYTVDRNPYKIGKYTPGTRIPICAPEKIRQTKPDYVLILPWNLKEEIATQLSYIHEWGGQFVVPIPEVRVFS
jgi:SAM-dependent methyltransferase